MSYTITHLDALPVLLVEICDPCDVINESRASQDKIASWFAGVTKPFFVIYDLRRLSFTFEDIVSIIADAVHTSANNRSIFEQYGRILFVGTGPLMPLVTVSASRFLPTSGQTKAFDTPEEALEYAHSQIAD